MELNALQKAAVLIASLDTATADQLLDGLDEAAAQQIRNTVLAMSDVPAQLAYDVVTEFLDRGGVGDRSVAARSPQPAVAESASSPTALPPAAAETDQQLADWDDGLLQFERPQVIAGMVRLASPGKARRMMDELPVATQAEVLRRMAKLGQPRTEVLLDAVREAWRRKQQGSSSPRRFDAGALTAVRQILDEEDEARRTELLKTLATIEPELVRELTGAAANAPAERLPAAA